MTPEGRVKSLIKECLASNGIVNAKDAGSEGTFVGWYCMPTPRGVKGIPDIMGHFHGSFFSIEAKAPGKEPSGFQLLQNDTIKQTGGANFIIDGEHSLNTFKRWLDNIQRR